MLFLLPGKTLPCPLHTSPPLSFAEFFQDLASLRTLFSDLLTCFLALFPHHRANHMNCVACLSSVSFTRLAALWMGTLSLITEFPASSSVLEKAMATHSSTLAWKIPWAEEPGRLQSMGSRRVGHDWATSLSLFTFMRWRRKWQPTPVFLPGESQGRGSLEGLRLWGRTESDTTEATWQQQQQCSCLENPRDRGAWWAAVYGVTQSWTWLKQLSSSSGSRVPGYFIWMYQIISLIIWT